MYLIWYSLTIIHAQHIFGHYDDWFVILRESIRNTFSDIYLAPASVFHEPELYVTDSSMEWHKPILTNAWSLSYHFVLPGISPSFVHPLNNFSHSLYFDYSSVWLHLFQFYAFKCHIPNGLATDGYKKVQTYSVTFGLTVCWL